MTDKDKSTSCQRDPDEFANPRISLLLYAQRALWGEVFPALRGVTIGWSPKVARWRCYYDGPLEPEDFDSMSAAAGEFAADLPEDWMLEEEYIRLDAPARMEMLDAWVYLRRER